MEIVIVLIFVSACLVALALIFFAWTVRERTFDHVERLPLLPLDAREHRAPRTTGAPEGMER